ncbi:poly A polymerase head domain protein [Lactobacillus selangorensis]|uniref:CCA-adding enzyme n=1 Tax=Lactobacillus selangorensis TaxID=81857 RepID=A0A0R2FVC5_9LACO|nr:CCA tRNA nucleotidyltransferase [Lactobacillus selangorensis]KRN29447.1 poly A polymerase head domain protein [Lactobacillus selangorensis]KRN34024.1 poly A polymerase head domain protein [Lactobacillus selangorensis]
MKITHFEPDFVHALPILRAIEAAGYEAYFVGGSVRDALLELPIHDVDIATSAYPAEVKQIFTRTIDTGIQHGTVTVRDHGHSYEVTTFRTESGYQDFRRPDHVTFVRSLKEDLKRRDFTINALAMREDGTILDLFHGLDDLKAHLIRAVGDPNQRFHEDALRMMRAVRFESQLGFTVEAQTAAAIKTQHELLSKIAIERTHSEFAKLMLGIKRHNGLTTFIQSELYTQCPDFATHRDDLISLSQLNDQQLTDEASAWLLIANAFKLTVAQTRKLLKDWKSSNELIATVAAGVKLLPLIVTGSAQPLDLYHAGADVLRITLEAAEILQGVAPETWQTQYDALPIHDKHELAINGKDLMERLQMQPGPQLGKALNGVERAIVLGQLENNESAILKWVQANAE